MHPTRVLLATILLALAASLVASCAHAPRVPEESDNVLSIRHDYLRSNPQGRYNEFIRRGEVVKGMTYVEVLASWGFPESRLRIPTRDLEYWRYVTRDAASRDWIQYTFVFEGNALFEWEMIRHQSKGRAMAQIEFEDPVEMPVDTRIPLEPSAALKR